MTILTIQGQLKFSMMLSAYIQCHYQWRNEDAADIITIIFTTTVSMLPSSNCYIKKKPKENTIPKAKSNSSNHLSPFISPFPPVFSSIRLSSLHWRFSLIHHSVSQSVVLLPAYSLPPSSSFHDTINISWLSLSFSSANFSPKPCCWPPVISSCVFFLTFFFLSGELLCLSSLIQCHPVGILPHWPLLHGNKTSVCTCTCEVSLGLSA